MNEKQNSRERSPAFQFYAGDWLTDPSLRMCSFETRGVWIDLLSIMFLSDEIGVLKIGNRVLDHNDVRKLVGISHKRFKNVWYELTNLGILKCDEFGRYFSKRMVGDERIRQIRRDVGRLGGNPNLKKQPDVLVPILDKQIDNQIPTPSFSYSSSKKNNVVILEHGKHFLNDQIIDNFQNIRKLKTQLSFEQCEKLEMEFNRSEILAVFEAMENFKPLISKYSSVFLTTKNWLQNRKSNGSNQPQTTNRNSKPNFDDAIRGF